MPTRAGSTASPSLKSLVRLARPKQWSKNVLVFTAPAVAGVLSHGHDALLAIGTFAIFSVAASGTYLLNDVVDAPNDRVHPVKKYRPVASGEVPAALAVALALVALVAAVAGSVWMSGAKLAVVIAIYAAITTSYSLWLGREPVVELACVSSGFVLRAIAGGVSTGVPLSVWFLVVASFGSLLIVAGKRSAERETLGADRAAHRPVLAAYPAQFLRTVRLLSAGVAVTAYCLWAFERSAHVGHGRHPIFFELSIIPFVLALLVLELRFETGHGGAPEDLAFSDRTLQLLGIAWVAVFAAGVYV